MKCRLKPWLALFVLVLAAFAFSKNVLAQVDIHPPVVTILATDPDASEIGPDTGTFTVSRDGPTNTELTVFYHVGGTAQPGEDYQPLSGHVTIPAGSASADILVTPIADIDSNDETNDTVKVQLVRPFDLPTGPKPPTPSPISYLIGWPSNAVVNIAEDGLVTNPPPHVRLVSPLKGAIFLAPADILLVAHAEDGNGMVETVEFFEGTNSLGVRTNVPVAIPLGPFVLTWSNVTAGEYTLTAKATDDQGASSVSEAVNIKVMPFPDTNPPSVITIVASDPDASEVGPDPGVFTVSRDGSTNDELTVFYHTSGTAKAGSDYQALSGRVTIPAGAVSADFTVTPIPDVDTKLETNETVVVQLLPVIVPLDDSNRPIIWPPPYVIGVPSNAVVTIAESGLVTNFPPHVRIVSPHDEATFTSPANITLIAHAEDAGGSVATGEFFEGTNSLGITTNMPVDNAIGPFVLTWSNVLAGDFVVTAKATDNLGATAVSDPITVHVIDVPPQAVVTIVASDPDASEIGPNPGTLTVSRTGPTNNDLSVFYRVGGSAKPGVDYKVLSGQVVIPAGTASADITVIPIPDVDTRLETNETVEVRLVPRIVPLGDPAGPIHFPSFYIVGDPSNAVVTIAESGLVTNPPPRVRIVSPEGGRKFAAPANIQIVARADDSNGTVSTVEFFEGTNSLGVTTNMTAINPLGPFVLVWSNVVAGEYSLTARATDDQGASSTSEPVRIAVVEVPPPSNSVPIVILYAPDPLAVEGTNSSGVTNTATFVVRRTDGTNTDLTVSYSVGGTASNGVDYVMLPGMVTIPAGHRTSSIIVTPLVDDDSADAPERLIETVVLRLTPPPSATNNNYVIGHPNKAAAIILDPGQRRPGPHELPGGLFHMSLPGMNGFWFRVEASDDLTSWTPVCTNAVTDGAIDFVDPDSDAHPHRFYRVLPEADMDTVE